MEIEFNGGSPKRKKKDEETSNVEAFTDAINWVKTNGVVGLGNQYDSTKPLSKDCLFTEFQDRIEKDQSNYTAGAILWQLLARVKPHLLQGLRDLKIDPYHSNKGDEGYERAIRWLRVHWYDQIKLDLD